MLDQPLLFQVWLTVHGPGNSLHSALTPNHVTGPLWYLLLVVNTWKGSLETGKRVWNVSGHTPHPRRHLGGHRLVSFRCEFVAMAMARERIGDLDTRKEIFLLIPTAARLLFLDLRAACGSFIWFHSQRSLSLTEVMNGSVWCNLPISVSILTIIRPEACSPVFYSPGWLSWLINHTYHQ